MEIMSTQQMLSRDLTAEEAEKLHSFNDLIENNIISSREYALGEYERNGYFTIKLFAPIYAALSNDDGTPGDLMGRRMAYELLAAKGFKRWYGAIYFKSI